MQDLKWRKYKAIGADPGTRHLYLRSVLFMWVLMITHTPSRGCVVSCCLPYESHPRQGIGACTPLTFASSSRRYELFSALRKLDFQFSIILLITGIVFFSDSADLVAGLVPNVLLFSKHLGHMPALGVFVCACFLFRHNHQALLCFDSWQSSSWRGSTSACPPSSTSALFACEYDWGR